MSGGITQLVATGVQDMYLSGNPEISFFRSSYKRYTHFAANVERQLIQGTPGPTGVSTIRFEKKGDLLSHVYLTALDQNMASNVNINWSTVISKMELMIGGQIIDTHDFTYTSNIEPVYGAQTFSSRASSKDSASSVFFPLKFFFCKDWQNALPLVALQYHDVEIRITWENPRAGDQYAVWARFIYLDKDEREWFAKKQHDMLIQQVTRVPMTDKNSYEFALSQPIKYIAFESNSYVNVYNTSVPLVNTSTALQVLVPPAGLGTILNLQAFTPLIQNSEYISAVSGNYVTISYQSQTAPSFPSGHMIDLSPLIITAQGTIVSSATLTSFTLNFAGNMVSLYGPNFYQTGAGAIVASGQAASIIISAVAVPVYSATSNLTSITFTCSSVNLGTSIVNPVITFVPAGFSTLASTGTATTTAAASTQLVMPYTATPLTVGQQVAIPQIIGQATVTAVSGGTSFTLTYVSQIVPTIPSGQQFFTFSPGISVDSAYTPVSLNQGSAAAANMQFKMQINGNDIGESRHLPHWQDINQYYLSPFGYDFINPNNVVIIPFCLDTSKLQPTGTLNFSRIDTFRLVTPTQTNFQQLSRFGAGSFFYAVNYNILRIQNGMAGILYSS